MLPVCMHMPSLLADFLYQVLGSTPLSVNSCLPYRRKQHVLTCSHTTRRLSLWTAPYLLAQQCQTQAMACGPPSVCWRSLVA